MSRSWSSFKAWVKDILQECLKDVILVIVVAVIFGMLQKPLLVLLNYIESILLAPLSPNWFGVFVVILIGYLLKWEWNHREIYVPRSVFRWLFLLFGIYLYYRHWEGSFSFWPIPFSFAVLPDFGELAWSDLLLLPLGGAGAIALHSRWEERAGPFPWLIVSICTGLLSVVRRDKFFFEWGVVSVCLILFTLMLGYIVLMLGYIVSDVVSRRRGIWLQIKSKREASKVIGLGSLSVGPDAAIASEMEDWLGYSGMAKSLCENLKAVELAKSSLSVGVIASWGKGKSSFMNLLKEQVQKEKAIIVTFNPRGSKSVSSIPEDFFGTFAEELSRHYLGFGLLIARYTKHLGLLNQYAWTRPLGSLLTLLLPGKEQEAVNRSLRELGSRVYVFLDDLDRLSAEEILEVLKLLDRNASFSNTVFITAYDKVYVNNVLRRHLDHGLNHCFIDKYISWEIPLPEPNKETLKRFMEAVLLMRLEEHSPALYAQLQSAWNKVASIVLNSLDSVRDLKRYLNLMMPRYQEVALEVAFDDYSLLYLLCYKDFGVYVALQSRRLVQLDLPSESYVLTPNLEEELNQVSQWDGAKEILEYLFSPRTRVGGKTMSSNSLRRESQFNIYFRGQKKESSIPYSEAVAEIIHSPDLASSYERISRVIEVKGLKKVANAFLYLVKSNVKPEEDRAKTIELMAYVAFKPSRRKGKLKPLRAELLELLSMSRYAKYKEFGIVQDLGEYHQLLERMLSFMSQKHPIQVSHWIDRVATWDGDPFQKCVYSIAEISAILLVCQDAYYNSWGPSAKNCRLALLFILKEYMNNYSQYEKQALQRLVSLIRKYPGGCIWMILSYMYDGSYDKNSFGISINLSLLNILEIGGFTLDEWVGLLKDRKCIYLLSRVGSTPKKEFFGRIELLPNEEMDLDSIDYVYRAVLAQEERDRQRASSEG